MIPENDMVQNLLLSFDMIDVFIKSRINEIYNNQTVQIDTPLDNLINFSELLDKLVIVNLKLYNLKNEQQQSQDEKRLAETTKEDVALCIERSRIKKALDHKLCLMIKKVLEGKDTGGCNPEIKNYG